MPKVRGNGPAHPRTGAHVSDDLQSYVDAALGDPEKQQELRDQWDSAVIHGTVICPCGLIRALVKAYRCLYCGLWFCVVCAEVHFGKTITEHRAALPAEQHPDCSGGSRIDGGVDKEQHVPDVEQATGGEGGTAERAKSNPDALPFGDAGEDRNGNGDE